jgi:pSer/pThr/pTyr-binding forkhead associated (FHA) protein
VVEGVGGSRTDIGEDRPVEAGIPSQFLPTPSQSPQSSTAGEGQGQYSLVFVNTPAQSLLKSEVQIDFDTFPTVTIGRDQENVVVIPDQNVSRLHAELSRDGNRMMLKDQQSTNGTYLYDGKEFQQVNDTVEVKPNSMIKFGTSTIVKLVCG